MIYTFVWEEITLSTKNREQLVNITPLVVTTLEQHPMINGVCYLYCQHTTAGITINENADPDVTRDLIKSLAKLVPRIGDYQHREGNSDAHLKASLTGISGIIPIIDGRLALGTWQGIYFCEFDGPRYRKFLIGFCGE